jgi:type I restriction enzyme, S subunit
MVVKWQRLGTLGRFSGSGIDKVEKANEQPVRMVNYTDVYGNSLHCITGQEKLMVTTAPPEKARIHSLRKSDILFTPSSETPDEIARSAAVLQDLPDTVYSYHLTRFRPAIEVDPNFAKYWCNIIPVYSQAESWCEGTTRQILTRDDFRCISVPVHPRETQRRIASFLDDETARIDALVEAKMHQSALLVERRQALIDEAVSGGGTATVPTGHDAMPFLPKSWRLLRLRHISPNIQVGIVVGPAKLYVEHDGVPAIRGTDVRPGKIDLEDLVTISRQAHIDNGKSRLHAGDIVVVRTGEPGRAAIVPAELEGSNCIDLVIVRQGPLLKSPFLLRALQSTFSRDQFANRSDGSAQQHFNVGAAKELLIGVPPVNEQDSICQSLERELETVDKTIEAIEESVQLLHERRQALVTAAVSGELKIQPHEVAA